MQGFGLRQLGELLDGYPGFVPGLIVAIVVAAVARGWVAARLGIARWLATALILAIGVIVAATLFPDVIGWVTGQPSPSGAAWSCDLGRLRPSLGELLDFGESTANTLLFVPLGIVVALLPRSIRPIAVVLAVVAPVGIELIQSALPVLDRRCQGADVADNLTGLVAGLVIGTLAGWWWKRRSGSPLSSR